MRIKAVKILMIVLCQIAGAFMPALAQNTATTDVTNIATALYSRDMPAVVNEQLVLPVFMKNSNDVTLFQTDVYLPEGFSFATKNNGGYAVTLDRTRLSDEDDDHAISAYLQADGALRILCSSQNNYTFDGNDGRVMSITLNVAENMAPGNYVIQMNNQRIVRPNNKGDNLQNYQAKVTVKINSYDIDNDGIVTIEDTKPVIKYLLESNTYDALYDVNNDGKVTILDIASLIQSMLKK